MYVKCGANSLRICIEELQSIAQKKAELQKKIEEIEKMARKQQDNCEQSSCAQVISHLGFKLIICFQ